MITIIVGIICATLGLLAHALCNVSGRGSEQEEQEETLRKVFDVAVKLSCENERLSEELADIHATHRRIMAEECPSDERHCTCVPALRSENAHMKTALLMAKQELVFGGDGKGARAVIDVALAGLDNHPKGEGGKP